MLGLFLLSAAGLVFEINLTRLFSVAQFYHFAFMIVSIALLGYGASGSFLAIFPKLGRRNPSQSLAWLSLATSFSILGSYLLTNWLPFDSFTIALDRRQAAILALHYLALAAPFFFSGMAVGLLLEAYPQAAGRTYAANLSGSALGCVVALVAPSWLGGEGTVSLSCVLAGLAGMISLAPSTLASSTLASSRPASSRPASSRPASSIDRSSVATRSIHAGRLLILVTALAVLGIAGYDLALRAATGAGMPALELHLSPYKGLSYALQYPGSQVVSSQWNATSRVDVIRSGGIRSLPGLSYRYLQSPPAQDGILVDGDELSPLLQPASELSFASYLPAAIAFELRPAARTLVLEPRGGLDVLTALSLGAKRVTAVEVNPLIVEAASVVYTDPRVEAVVETDRSYLRRTDQHFEVILFSLANAYHPVRSGAYSLGEDYRYTVEAFEEAFKRLEADGILLTTRWLQNPPSEELRLFALAVTAVENLSAPGGDITQHIVALRGYNTATLLVKKAPFTAGELQAIRQFAASRAFDLVYAPGLGADESNQYNILPEPTYYQAFKSLLETRPRQDFYASYPFEVSPPTDDKPFFNHFFKWSQAGQVLAELGKTWQPFGGAGYFVVLALLGLAIILAVIVILLPLAAARWRSRRSTARPGRSVCFSSRTAYLLYFGFLGLAFLLVEIPLVQRFILYLGQPAYALAAVIFTLLLFSGIGSRFSSRIPLNRALLLLVLLLLASLFLQPALFTATLGLPLPARLALTVITLAPIGFLMGVPFPGGIQRLAEQQDDPLLIPWVWAVNGAASVISAVLAALLALTLGFRLVLALGTLCYAAAWISAWAWRAGNAGRRPAP